MEKVPNEILIHILEKCDTADWIGFRATSTRNHAVGSYVLGKSQTFDFRHYNNHCHYGICRCLNVENDEKINGTNLNPTKMINFMGFLPSLRKIVLADLPCVLTMSDMIKLGKSVPNVQKIIIIQNEDKKWLGNDVLMGLTYFKSLVKLKLDGWEPTTITRRGCASRIEAIPQSTLRKLVNFHIVCRQETVSTVLRYIIDNEVIMAKCVKAKFNVRLSSPDIPHLILKFIEFHRKIQKIHFNGFLFTTQEQVQAFYDHLLNLPQLETVRIENCSVIERIEHALQRTFLDALRKRGIKFTCLVTSLRHGY